MTVANFTRAETHMYFANSVRQGALGRIVHFRTPTPIDKQDVIRMNRDTLYSFGVFDLDAGAATIELPDVGKRFMSLLVIDEDHYALQAARGSFEIPNWDTAARDEIRKLLLALSARAGTTTEERFGARDTVNPIQHLLASAAGWGGNPREAQRRRIVHDRV